MATNNVTIDYNRLETFHPAKVDPTMVDVFFKAYPTAALFYQRAMTGSLDGIAQIKDWASRFIHGGKEFPNEMIGGHGSYEWPVEFLPVSGTVSGPGVQTITNNPVEAYTKARVKMSPKYTPIALPEDEYSYAQSAGQGENGAVAMATLMTKYFGTGMKTHLRDISTDILGTNTDSDEGILSLKAGTGTSASDTSTYANISRSSINAWRGNYDEVDESDWLVSTSVDYSWNILGTNIDTLTSNGVNPMDLVIIMGSTAYKGYRQGLTGTNTTSNAYGRFQINSGRGIPYAELYYNNIPIILDTNASTKDCFILDTETTKMIGVPGSVFALSDWKMGENSTIEWARIKTISNVVTCKPNANYYMPVSGS